MTLSLALPRFNDTAALNSAMNSQSAASKECVPFCSLEAPRRLSSGDVHTCSTGAWKLLGNCMSAFLQAESSWEAGCVSLSNSGSLRISSLEAPGSRECVRFGSLEAPGRLNVYFKSGSSRESAYMQLLRLEAPEKLHVCISSVVWKPCEF